MATLAAYRDDANLDRFCLLSLVDLLLGLPTSWLSASAVARVGPLYVLDVMELIVSAWMELFADDGVDAMDIPDCELTVDTRTEALLLLPRLLLRARPA